MSRKFDVDIIAHTDSTSKDQLAALCGNSLERVTFRTVDQLALRVLDPCAIAQRYERLRTWGDELTSRYDLFVNFTDRLPVFCSARNGVLMVQSACDFIPLIYRAFLTSHLSSYQLKLTSSYYTRFWAKVFWDIDSEVVYPPLGTQALTPVAKEDIIVILGPIDPSQHQLELIAAFRQLKTDLPDWSLVIMGRHDDDILRGKRYFDLLKAAGDDGVSILTNPSAVKQSEMLRGAKILWCGIGLEKDLDVQPQRIESFRLDVVEAMANGCVPLTTNSTSFSEVIRHRESGMFWDTTDELLLHTSTLARDQNLLGSLSEAAQERVRAFDSEKFTESFLQHLKDAFGIRSVPLVSPGRLWKRLIRSADQFLVTGR
jgi:glycosyltransferase involved in cell wall biosynthesis